MGSLYRRKKRGANGEFHELPTWWIKYRQNGRTMRESTETTKETVARRILRTREGDVEKGIPINPKMGKITFDEAVKDLLNDYTVNGRKTHDDAERRITLHLEPAFRGKRLIAITTDVIRQYVVERPAAGASAGTINRELSALRRMFRLAIAAGQLYTKPHFPMLRENNARKGFFEPEQFHAVRSHLPLALRPVVSFAYLTGWRIKSEILPLEWRQVDWQGREVRLDPGTTKNGEGRSFPFTAELEALLRQQLAEFERFKKAGTILRRVFHRSGKAIKSFRGAWLAACKKAGCPGCIPHDFRRTAVRNLEQAGVSRSTAMSMVGHRTVSVYQRYAIGDAGSQREAARRIDSVMGTLLGTLPPQTAQSGTPRSR
jgi:integrase